MPTKLSALLVQDRVVSFRQMDAAVQRQQALGGRIGTNLLELGHVDEGILLYYVSKQRHVPAMDNNAWLDVDPDALAAWDAEQAVALMAVPFAIAGGALQVAVTDPLPDEFVAAFRQDSGLEIEQFLALEVRMWQALGTLYGADVPPRFAQLAERFPVPMRTRDGRVEAHRGHIVPGTTADPDARVSDRRPPEFDIDGDHIPGLAWRPDELAAFFEASNNRDQMLLAALGFVGKFFPRRALYVVARNGIRGFAIQLPGQPQRPIERVEMPTAPESALGRIIAGGSFYFGPLDESGAAPLYDQLGIARPPDVCVVPVQVGPRAVLLLVADGGDSPIDPQGIPVTFLAVNGLSGGLERLIRRIKLRRSAAFAIVSTPSDDDAPPEQRTRDDAAVAAELHAAAITQRIEILDKLESSGAQRPVPSPNVQRLPTEGWDFDGLEAFELAAARAATPAGVEVGNDDGPDTAEPAAAPAGIDPGPIDVTGPEATVEGAADTPAESAASATGEALAAPESAPPVEEAPVREPSISGVVHVVDAPTIGDAPGDVAARTAFYSPVGGVPAASEHAFDVELPSNEGLDSEDELSKTLTMFELDGAADFRVADDPGAAEEEGELDAAADEGELDDEQTRVKTDRQAGEPGGFADAEDAAAAADAADAAAADAAAAVDDDDAGAAAADDVDEGTAVAPRPTDSGALSGIVARLPSSPSAASYGYENRVTGQLSIVAFRRREEDSGPQPAVPVGRLEAIDLDVRLPGVLQPPLIREPANAEETAFRDRVLAAGDEQLIEWLTSPDPALSGAAFVALLDRGQEAHDALMAHFPGPLLVERRAAQSVMQPKPLERHGPVVWLVALQLRSILPRLYEAARSPDADTRYYACRLLQQAGDAAALDTMADLLFDVDPQIRDASLQFLENHLPERGRAEHPVTIAIRRRLLATEPWVVDTAVSAINRLRDSGAVPDLLAILDHPSDRTRQKAAQALSRLTFQDFGVNRKRWERWYRKNGMDSRRDWLLEAMVDREWKVRDNAARELRSYRRLVVNYHPDIDKGAREVARRAVHRFLYGRDGGDL